MQAQDFIAKRRDRVIATLLGLKERELDSYLPEHVRQKYRKAILDTINEFTDAVFDVIGSLDDGTVVLNDIWLEKIRQIHERVMEDAAE